MSAMSLKEVLGQLSAENLLNEAAIDDISMAAADVLRPKRPWYVQLLIAFTAWFASLFFIAFVGLFIGPILASEAIAMLIVGGGLVAGAWVLQRRTRTLFVEQLLLVALIVGEVLVIIALAEMLVYDSNVTTVPLVVLVVLMVTWLLFPHAVHRFLATLGIVAAAAVLLYDWAWLDGVHLLLAAIVGATVWLWWQRPYWLGRASAERYAPLAYALPLSLFVLLLLPLFNETDMLQVRGWWITTLILLAAIVIVVLRVFREHNGSAVTPAGIAAFVGVVAFALPAWQLPGIAAGLLVLLLGFWRGNRLLMVLATLYWLFGISFYYYNLDMTLLNKSLALIASGVVCLVGFGIVQRMVAGE